ncbi:hypothetical protein U1Q18_016111 [Sarracenia purpurea var. burkii]
MQRSSPSLPRISTRRRLSCLAQAFPFAVKQKNQRCSTIWETRRISLQVFFTGKNGASDQRLYWSKTQAFFCAGLHRDLPSLLSLLAQLHRNSDCVTGEVEQTQLRNQNTALSAVTNAARDGDEENAYADLLSSPSPISATPISENPQRRHRLLHQKPVWDFSPKTHCSPQISTSGDFAGIIDCDFVQITEKLPSPPFFCSFLL